MVVRIDESAGFCWGVVQTIDKVEDTLAKFGDKKIHVLGQIIHNPKEGERLASKGLNTISHNDMDSINPDDSLVIIRAHGEPPSTYKMAEERGLEIIDATCPLVKSFQTSVKRFYNEGWQVVVFGKRDHAEVIGVRGVCNDDCIVIKDAESALSSIDFSKKTVLFSQTTMDWYTFCDISDQVGKRFEELYGDKKEEHFITKNTTCKFVSKREDNLVAFAKSNDFVIFVAGRNSSNGKILFDLCKKANDNSVFVEDIEEIDFSMLSEYSTIGITGATSTPQWYMEHIKSLLDNKFNN